MLDFRNQTFLSVCRHMNFTRASQELHITQPAVSQHIRFLEHLYQTSLFLREGKHIRLTPAGEILLATMTQLRNDERAMMARMRVCAGEKRTLRFGVTLTIGEYIIAGPLARFLQSYPQTDLHVHFGNTSALLEQLREGELDFALVEGYFRPDAYETMVYRTEPYIPVCAKGHAFSHPVHRLKDLLSQRLLVREMGSGTRDILEKNLALRGMRIEDFSHVTQVESTRLIVSLLVQDCGIAFLYQAAVRRELAEGTLVQIPLADFSMEHDFVFLWNRTSAFSSEYAHICHALSTL